MFDRTAEFIQPYLNPGEHILWAGRPRAGVILRTADFFMIPFSLVWGGGACAAAYATYLAAPILPKLFVSFFVLIALYLIAGRFFVDTQRRANTYYALTNQRALIIVRGWGGSVKSFSLRNPVAVELEQKPNLSGTVAFGHVASTVFRGGAGLPANVPQPLMFEEIPNAGEVYQMVLAAQRQAQREG